VILSPSFIEIMKNRMGIGEPETNATDTYERGMKIAPDNIRLNDGEVAVKQYDMAILRTRWKFMRAEGRLQVTNKRLLFRATGRSIMGRTAIQHEFAIDQIGGIEIRKDYRFGILEALIALAIPAALGTSAIGARIGAFPGLLLGILGLIPFFALKKMFLLKVIACGISVAGFTGAYASDENIFFGLLAVLSGIVALMALFLYCFKPNLIFTIKTTGANEAIEIRRKKTAGLLSLFFGNNSSDKEEYTGYSEVLPWRETEIAIREIGAMISDIQKLGDFGIEKWKVD